MLTHVWGTLKLLTPLIPSTPLTLLSPTLLLKFSHKCVSKLWMLTTCMTCSHVSHVSPMWMPHRCLLTKTSLEPINRALVSSIFHLPHMHCVAPLSILHQFCKVEIDTRIMFSLIELVFSSSSDISIGFPFFPFLYNT